MNTIIVIGNNYSTIYEVVRSLGENGFFVWLISFSQDTIRITGSSKYVIKKTLIDRTEKAIIDNLKKFKNPKEKKLVIPCDDYTTYVLDKNADELADYYYFPNINHTSGELVKFMEKNIQKKFAKECGLLVADGMDYLTDEQGLEKALSEITYPCFLKPLASADVQSAKSFFCKCKDQHDLQNAMKLVAMNGCRRVLIEEYLDIQKELCLYGFAAHGLAYIPVCIETIRDGHLMNKGVTAEGKVFSSDFLGDFVIKSRDFVQRSGLTGLFCIDIIFANNSYYFSEINLRTGGSEYAATILGANLPGTFAQMVYDGDGFFDLSVDSNRKAFFLNERIELNSYINGYIPFIDFWKHMHNEQEKFIQNSNDPEPWRFFQKKIIRSIMSVQKRKLFSIFKK